ncbi:hypothetical protein J437_LFUL010345 [Ladona fulva]|uniref:TsaA-like domain-containing protein n=1 Tax=Ladona fulva TaxID=123851 RepID=A0A8K0JUC5_LADFU|nr:hypothetical protein J437_LFUL010345 [Ladona fulva]
MADRPSQELEDLCCHLRNQLSVARSEINNLRQQIKSLSLVHQKDIQKVKETLGSWKCQGCLANSENCQSFPALAGRQPDSGDNYEKPFSLQPIGIVSTWFPQKKGTPRQPGICKQSQGVLKLFNHVFTNPEHSLEGIEQFSHMWILFYFHKNESTHIRAKVAPPRLNGNRVGLFGTRSPHRPSPIGLSLVKIEKVEGSAVYFSGVDMIDGTPVLDIKPYIPEYDNPCNSKTSYNSCTEVGEVIVGRLMDGRELEDNDEEHQCLGVRGEMHHRHSSAESLNTSSIGLTSEYEREAPDGEEDEICSIAQASGMATNSIDACVADFNEEPDKAASDCVTVPQWISKPPVPKLSVEFSGRAEGQLKELSRLGATLENMSEKELDVPNENALKKAIASVLCEDPRSVYLREKWSSQAYTFLIHNFHVSCKFDDNTKTVTVSQIRSSNRRCECDLPEWQCRIHADE